MPTVTRPVSAHHGYMALMAEAFAVLLYFQRDSVRRCDRLADYALPAWSSRTAHRPNLSDRASAVTGQRAHEW
ncbi:hypothetical protein POSPLADRAFT_1039811 [Postia placenta MAD-698-R-SB12]|uniref:Uncharacterized protein n=1 Tax=Postia placenta MAD-698-R-SB12 TaxID=670580 RepID=A0A1X6N2Z9_9APHY|nr:hypothetical protein POSPLADRAFT_1039811 [Postia placenta MAD-698-R-SB12]OSX62978.1 hypothetical protein POSPLADRAFT_1039811 [Postia placenta MAD-698-R-SB12]